MKTIEPLSAVDETTSIREFLLLYPKAIQVLLDREVPISCAGSTIGDAARACGVPPATLLAELLACPGQSRYGAEDEVASRQEPRPTTRGAELLEGTQAPTSQSAPGQADRTTPSWHALPIDEVLDLLQAEPGIGLSRDEAGRRLDRFGPNTVQTTRVKKRKPWWRSLRWASPGWSGRGWT